jgi:Carboxypeptidase regulatory-like domain
LSNRSSYARLIASGVLPNMAFTFVPLTLGQSTGAIQGTVTDASGAAVPTGMVTIKDPAHGVNRTTLTDSAGIYNVPSLPVGDHSVDVKAPGLSQMEAKGLIVEVSTTVTQNVALTVASSTRTVEFQASANTAAFVLNPLNTFGTAGRNILTGPSLKDVDISLLKAFPVREHVAVQFRATCYNISNTPNFGQPGNSVGSANFGVISATRSQAGDFGSSRQIEFALKVLF